VGRGRTQIRPGFALLLSEERWNYPTHSVHPFQI
jgi:hypothetical protein